MSLRILILAGLTVFASSRAAASICASKGMLSPLTKSLFVESKYDPARRHYGVDYRSNGDDVVSVKDGKVRRVGFDLRQLKSANARTGLKKQGYGAYVLITHPDGSESLYAHLEPESIKVLAVGASVTAGAKIGRSDSSGGVTGPHLHFEYSESGNIFDIENKTDPDRCVLRKGSLNFRGITALHGGVFELMLDGRSLGAVDPGKRRRFDLDLVPGTYRLSVRLLKAQHGKKGGYAFELSDGFVIINSEGAELAAGANIDEMPEGTAEDLLMRVGL